jgi:CheY-like chemotaxis protein
MPSSSSSSPPSASSPSPLPHPASCQVTSPGPATPPLDWATTCGHELKTPVAQLQSLLELLDHGFLPVEQRKWLSLARQSARHLEHRVHHLLDLGMNPAAAITTNHNLPGNESPQLPHATTPPSDQWTDLRSVLTHVFSMAYIQAHAQYGLAFEWHVCASVPCYVALNECNVRQILDNLLGNAFLYTRQGSVSLSVAVQGDSLHFTVADTGCGIAPQDRERIFNARVSVPPSPASSPLAAQSVSSVLKTHHGVGLYLARQYAHSMHGQLTLLPSNPNASTTGSAFLLEVPFRPGLATPTLPDITPNPEMACQRLDWVFCPNPTVLPSPELLKNPTKPFCMDGRGIANQVIQEWMNRFAHLLTHRPTIVLVVPDQRWQMCSLINHPLWQAGRQHYIASHPTDLWAIAGILALSNMPGTLQGVLPMLPDKPLDSTSSPTSLPEPTGGLLSGQGLKGQRIVYLTPDDCGCGDDVVAALERLGMHTQVCLYPKGPPSPPDVLKRYQDPDWVCLCTSNMTFEEVHRWVEDPIWKTLSTPVMIMDQAGEWQGAGSRFNTIAPGRYLPLAGVDQFAQAFASVAFHRVAHSGTSAKTVSSTGVDDTTARQTDQCTSRPDGSVEPVAVLVIEDNAISRLILTYQLESLGHRVQSAVGLAHAQELIRRMVSHNGHEATVPLLPGMVLMDLNLPDGAPVSTMVQALRDSGLPVSVPVVGLTAYARPNTIAEAKSQGLVLCLSKPVDWDQWPAVLHQVTVKVNTSTLRQDEQDTSVKVAEVKGPRHSDDPISWPSLVAMLQHNDMLAREIAQLFLLDTPPLLASIENAIIDKHWSTVVHQAHQLKGSAVYLHAKTLCRLAYQLENVPKAEPSPQMQSDSLGLYRQIVREFEACAQFLRPFVAMSSPASMVA